MSNGRPLDPEFVLGVVEHMNEDHADAVLAIARHYGKDDAIESALMSGLSTDKIFVAVESPAGRSELALSLPKPIRDPADVRAILIRMSRTARGA